MRLYHASISCIEKPDVLHSREKLDFGKFAKETGLALEDALSFFYDSDTYQLIREGIADLHCRSDEYLADELMIEYREKDTPSPMHTSQMK